MLITNIHIYSAIILTVQQKLYVILVCTKLFQMDHSDVQWVLILFYSDCYNRGWLLDLL